MVRRYRPPGSPPPVPRRRPRYTGRPDGPWNIGLFAGYDAGFAPQEGDGWDPAWNWRFTGLTMMRAGPARMLFLTTAMTRPRGRHQEAHRPLGGAVVAQRGQSSVREPQDLSRGRQRCLAEDTRRERAVPRAQALLPRGARIPPGGERPAAAFRRPDGPEYWWAALASGGPAWTEIGRNGRGRDKGRPSYLVPRLRSLVTELARIGDWGRRPPTSSRAGRWTPGAFRGPRTDRVKLLICTIPGFHGRIACSRQCVNLCLSHPGRRPEAGRGRA